ncbi:hypothetical protein MHYP_G00260580 [Metynnis hypsauchen]
MYEAIEAFRLKLGLFERDIQGRKLHFPKLKQHCEKNKMQEDAVMRACLGRLKENFKVRLESFNLSSEILFFLRQPFSASADGQWTAEAKRLLPSLDEASLQMEILEMSKSDLLKEQHKDVSVTDFWTNMMGVNWDLQPGKMDCSAASHSISLNLYLQIISFSSSCSTLSCIIYTGYLWF